MIKIKKLNHLKKTFLEIRAAIKMDCVITIDAIIIGCEEKKYVIKLVAINETINLFIIFNIIFIKILS